MSKTPQETNPESDAKADAITDSTLDVTKLTDAERLLASALAVSRRAGGTVILDSQWIDWKAVAYTVGGCWMICGLTGILGSAPHVAPVAILVAAVVDWVLGLGLGSGHEFEIIFVYWTLVGVWLSWRMHTGNRFAHEVIGQGVVLHIVVNLVAWLPTAILVYGH